MNLAGLGLLPGDAVLVHSDLDVLGLTPCELLALLAAAVGRAGVVLAPAYSWAFCRGDLYDHDLTRSEAGLFGEFLRRRGRRTFHPVYSHAVWPPRGGPEAVSRSSFGLGSAFDWLLARKGKLLFAGAGFRSCTFVHHAEEEARAPYRELVVFPGLVRAGGTTWFDEFEMYARRDGVPAHDFARLEADLRAAGQLAGDGPWLLASARDVYDQAVAGLAVDGGYLLERA